MTRPLAEILFDLVRLLPDDERAAIVDGAALRERALGVAHKLGATPTPEAVRAAAMAFRRRRGLTRASDVEPWCAARAVPPEAFARLMSDEAALRAVGGVADAMSAASVADFLRVADGGDALFTRARLVRDAPPAHEASARERLHAWYETALGRPVPDDVDDDARRRGFDDRDDLLRALADTQRLGHAPSLGALAVGDPLPEFVLAHPALGDVRPDLLAGRWWALVLGDDGALAAAAARSLSFVEGVAVAPPADALPDAWVRLDDREHTVRTRLRLGEGTHAVLVDPAGRVAVVEAVRDAADVGARLRAAVERAALASDATGACAPVVVVPGAFEAAFCEALIARWHAHGSVAGSVTATGNDGAGAKRDEDLKRRRDHVIDDAALEGEIRARLARRVFPELRRAFQFEVTACEGFRVGCYDAADGGFFRAHRDDANPAVAHRRFALSVNLAHGAYDGGRLRLPEYVTSLDAPTGAAVVYSASLLHEVEAVTRGRRFALVGFFSGASR